MAGSAAVRARGDVLGPDRARGDSHITRHVRRLLTRKHARGGGYNARRGLMGVATEPQDHAPKLQA